MSCTEHSGPQRRTAQGRSAARSCRARSRTTATRSNRATGSSLVVEEDAELAKMLLGKARERGFKGIVAQRGDAGLALVHEFKPDAIILDLKLPVMDGWTVLDHLKHHPATRHIPVHIVSADGDGAGRAARRRRGGAREAASTRRPSTRAFNGIEQFLARDVKNLLIVEDDEEQRRRWWSSIGDGDDVEVTAVGTSEEALDALAEKRFDCVVARPEAARRDRLRAARGARRGTASSATCR